MALAAVAAGCGGPDTRGRSTIPADTSATEPTVASVLQTLDPDARIDVRVGKPPSGYDPGGLWATFTITSPDVYRYVFAKWESLVALGLVDARRGHDFGGATFLRIRNHKAVFDSSGAYVRDDVTLEPAPRDVVKERLVAAAQQHHFHITESEFLTALDRDAVVLHVTAFEQHDDLALVGFVNEVARNVAGPEGIFVFRIDDAGKIIECLGYAVRSSTTFSAGRKPK